jgi:hypothetical protein
MLKFLDTYTLKAQAIPAMLATAPAIALVIALVLSTSSSMSKIFSTSIIAVLVVAIADLGRRLGKKKEPGIYAKLGGMPSVVMLRHRDSTFDPATKARYLAFLGRQIKGKPPTDTEEIAAPGSADSFYGRCGTWLREHTRDTRKFRLVFVELVTYGFRRNLYGLRWLGLAVNFIVVGICCVYLYRGGWWGLEIAIGNGVIFVVLVAAVHAIYLAVFATRASVIEASRQYARQLILSCEMLMPKAR